MQHKVGRHQRAVQQAVLRVPPVGRPTEVRQHHCLHFALHGVAVREGETVERTVDAAQVQRLVGDRRPLTVPFGGQQSPPVTGFQVPVGCPRYPVEGRRDQVMQFHGRWPVDRLGPVGHPAP
ncbi:hypothetical protein [Corynebacterium variabile]|uniref:hypothetical protein n=1 Tax=Corynebacterium variabile TaxID=1727 RepID=UPI0028AB2AD6|nr:hypothetical protein [Corynebacterium variabile]